MKHLGKSPEITNLLDNVAKKSFGRTRTDSLSGNICVICGEEAFEFRDALSRKEYGISGMCQKCQDKIFGE